MNENEHHRSNTKNWSQDLEDAGGSLWARTQDLVRYGTTRQIVIQRGRNLQLLAFPLVFGVLGAILLLWLAPSFLAIAAIVALFAGVRLEIRR